MGMYDQLLSVTQQGLDRNNQIAMASAQQPTMADVFMDRFRQGGQDRMAAQKMQSDMAMNEAYKNAQMQQMQTTADWHKRQRDLELVKYISENKTGENGPEVEAFVRSQGGSADLVPKMRFQESPYQVESGPAFPGGSLSEGGEDTETTKMGQMPVEWSDWGAGAAFKQKGLDMKQRLAEMSMQTKSYLASLKASDAKSAVGKIMQDLQNKIIRPELAHDAILKATVFFDPANAALIGQGLNPTGSGLPIRQFQQTPGAATLPQPQVQPAQLQMPLQSMPQPQRPMPAPAQPQVAPPAAKRPAPAAPSAVPGVKAFPGGKAAVVAQEADSLAIDVQANFSDLLGKVEKALKHPGSEWGTGAKGLLGRNIPGSDAKSFAKDLESIKSQLGLEQLTQGYKLGSVTEAEHTLLQNKIRALDPEMKWEDLKKNLEEIQTIIKGIKDRAATKANDMARARGTESKVGKPKAMTLDEYLAAQRK